jgi:hypothetical protein
LFNGSVKCLEWCEKRKEGYGKGVINEVYIYSSESLRIGQQKKRWEQQRRRKLPVLSRGIRHLPTLGRDVEVEAVVGRH